MNDFDNDKVIDAVVATYSACVDGDNAAAEKEWKQLPVAVRAVVAAVALGADGRDVTGKQLAAVGKMSRGNLSGGPLAEKLKLLPEIAGPLAEFLLGDAKKHQSSTDLAAEVRDRDNTISELRKAHNDQEALAKESGEYAADLYATYAFPTVEENMRTRQQVVVDVKPERWGRLKIVEDECATEPSEHPSAGTESQHD